MSDPTLLEEILIQVIDSIQKIERRFSTIQSADDFRNSEEGIDRLDGICMMLIVIGESLKQFERAGGTALMEHHPDIDWKGVKGIRDVISHHYSGLDTEVVFATCQDQIPGLKQTILSMREELQHK